MSKWMVVGLIICVTASAANAAKGDATKEKYMATQKAQAEKKGMEFNAKKAEKMFEQMDTNGDGIASGAEKQAYWGKGKQKSAPTAKPAAAKAVVKKAPTDKTKAEFVAMEKAKWEQKGWRWDQAKVEANFDEMDKDKDGLASGKERHAWFAKKKASQK